MDIAADTPGAITQDQIDALLREATNSVTASKAWSWQTSGTLLQLRAQLPPIADPRHRTALLDGGAILLNLRLLIRGLGVHPAVRLFPDPARRDVVATVWLEGPRPVTEQDRVLVTALLSGGRPVGSPAESSTAAGSLISSLRRAAKAEQAWLAAQPMTAVLSATPDADAFGLDGTALIIGTVLDGPAAQLQAGQAAQRTILSAATLGVPVVPLPDVLESDGNRQAVRTLLGGGVWPQALLRTEAKLQPSPA